MTKPELIDRIKKLALDVFKNVHKTELAAIEYDELTKFPELKAVIVSLLTADFDVFLASIDWVAPRPTTFRINLKNDQEFYLIFNQKGWIAQIEGKKYFLSSDSEEGQAADALARVLRYGVKEEEPDEKDDDFKGDDDFSPEDETPEEEI